MPGFIFKGAGAVTLAIPNGASGCGSSTGLRWWSISWRQQAEYRLKLGYAVYAQGSRPAGRAPPSCTGSTAATTKCPS